MYISHHVIQTKRRIKGKKCALCFTKAWWYLHTEMHLSLCMLPSRLSWFPLSSTHFGFVGMLCFVSNRLLIPCMQTRNTQGDNTFKMLPLKKNARHSVRFLKFQLKEAVLKAVSELRIFHKEYVSHY